MTDDTRQDTADATQDTEAERKKLAKQPRSPNPKGCKQPPATATDDQTGKPEGGAEDVEQTSETDSSDPSASIKPCEPTPDPAKLPKPPKAPEPSKCKTECKCPTAPTQPTDCLEGPISALGKEIKEAERATSFKAELESIRDKTQAGKLEYTQARYEALLKLWKEQDGKIVDLLKKVTCRLPCWRCMVECSVCELIYAIRNNERLLSGTGVPFAPDGNRCYTSADSRYDLQYWHERNSAARQAEFDRIKAVLAAWEKPAQTVDKALADDAQLIAAGENVTDAELPKFVYDLFFILIPRHLSIAPPAADAQTTIQRKYADLICPCDKGAPEDCCGPDTGPLSLRERLVGPLPYLLKPELYSTVICCLVQCRYVPAKNALAAAEGELAAAQQQVKKAQDFVKDKLASLDKDAKANLLEFKCDPADSGDNEGGAGKEADELPETLHT